MPDIVSWLDKKQNTWYFMDEPYNQNDLFRFQVNPSSSRYLNRTVNIYVYKNDQFMLSIMDHILKYYPVLEYDHTNGLLVGPSREILTLAFRQPVCINLPLDYEAIIVSKGFTPPIKKSKVNITDQDDLAKSRIAIIRKYIPEDLMAFSSSTSSQCILPPIVFSSTKSSTTRSSTTTDSTRVTRVTRCFVPAPLQDSTHDPLPKLNNS